MCTRILAAVVGLLLLGSGLALAATSYTQVFDVAPATPQPARPLTDWDVVVHSDSIDPATWLEQAGTPMNASHGGDCGAPPATHPVSAYDDTVFFCKNHIMTSIFGGGGYAAIYLTPPQMIDFSTGEAVLRWDMSTLRSSPRDWMDVWITPYADALQMPLENDLPDLQGPPRRAVNLRMDNCCGGTMFRTRIYQDFLPTDASSFWYHAYESVLVPDAARRDTFELHLSRTHVKFGMPAYNFWWSDLDLAVVGIPDLGWDQGVVQFGHHSYNPTKDCDTCLPNTWHWDNVTLSSAIPFTLGKVRPRAISNQGTAPLAFDAPAPAGASLRFNAFAENVQVSWDGGALWANAPTGAQIKHDASHVELYQVPVPEGATAAQVRGTGGAWGEQWQARDFSVWSQIDARSPTRTPTPLPLTRTVTPMPATATVTPLPTATLGPTSTPQPSPTLPPTPTPAPNPTATPEPGPLCQLTSIINGALVNTALAPTSCPQ